MDSPGLKVLPEKYLMFPFGCKIILLLLFLSSASSAHYVWRLDTRNINNFFKEGHTFSTAFYYRSSESSRYEREVLDTLRILEKKLFCSPFFGLFDISRLTPKQMKKAEFKRNNAHILIRAKSTEERKIEREEEIFDMAEETVMATKLMQVIDCPKFISFRKAVEHSISFSAFEYTWVYIYDVSQKDPLLKSLQENIFEELLSIRDVEHVLRGTLDSPDLLASFQIPKIEHNPALVLYKRWEQKFTVFPSSEFKIEEVKAFLQKETAHRVHFLTSFGMIKFLKERKKSKPRLVIFKNEKFGYKGDLEKAIENIVEHDYSKEIDVVISLSYKWEERQLLTLCGIKEESLPQARIILPHPKYRESILKFMPLSSGPLKGNALIEFYEEFKANKIVPYDRTQAVSSTEEDGIHTLDKDTYKANIIKSSKYNLIELISFRNSTDWTCSSQYPLALKEVAKKKQGDLLVISSFNVCLNDLEDELIAPEAGLYLSFPGKKGRETQKFNIDPHLDSAENVLKFLQRHLGETQFKATFEETKTLQEEL